MPSELESRYRQLATDYNKLVREHNSLVDNHNKVTNDAQFLLKFVEDLTKGMKAYVREGIQLGALDPCEHVRPLGNSRLNESKVFVAELHNLVADFMKNLRDGISVEYAYALWINKCHASKNNDGGGIII